MSAIPPIWPDRYVSATDEKGQTRHFALQKFGQIEVVNRQMSDMAERNPTLRRSPRIAQRAGASVSLRAVGEFAVEFGDQRPVRREPQLRARRRERRIVRIGAPKDGKARAGKGLKRRR